MDHIEDKFKDNIYFKQSPEMFKKLVELVEKNPVSYSRLLKNKQYAGVVCWLHQTLVFLDNDEFKFNDYPFCYIIYVVFNNIQDFPVCQVCNKKLKAPKYFHSGSFHKACSKHCEKICRVMSFKSTSLKLYGTEHPMKNASKYEEYCNKLEKKLGVKNVFQLESTKEASRATRLKKYGNADYRNIEKSRSTRQQKYGCWEPKSSKDKRKQTFSSHYGVDNNMKCVKGIKEYQSALEDKYGAGIVNPS